LASLVPLSGGAGAASTSPTYYVSLGDSYSVGYQPGLGATPGYTGVVAHFTHFKLVNFGCAGATTVSIIDQKGCPLVLPHTAGGVKYPKTTQAQAAESFLSAHKGHIGLITVSISGNDVTACAAKADPLPCVNAAVGHITSNVTALAVGLRAAAGPHVPIIGLTYPDVILGVWVYPKSPASATAQTLAGLSVTAFQTVINPALEKAYGTVDGGFVDVTAATGAYTPLTTTEAYPPYGTIPTAVGDVCTYSWFCKKGNIHATTKGYDLIGQLVTAQYDTIAHAAAG